MKIAIRYSNIYTGQSSDETLDLAVSLAESATYVAVEYPIWPGSLQKARIADPIRRQRPPTSHD